MGTTTALETRLVIIGPQVGHGAKRQSGALTSAEPTNITHMQEARMHAGTSSEWKPVVMAGYTCPKCAGPLQYRDWESSCGSFEDQQFKCTACGHSWWCEGPDA